MTPAEKALLDAACEHWISGRFNHLIIAVIQEREVKRARVSELTLERCRCFACTLSPTLDAIKAKCTPEEAVALNELFTAWESEAFDADWAQIKLTALEKKKRRMKRKRKDKKK